MRIASIRITDVRSLADVEVEPDPHINLLVGPNGHGKDELSRSSPSSQSWPVFPYPEDSGGRTP